jgi:hypothetical protein
MIPSDRRFLDELEKKFQIVRDYTQSVAQGRTTDFYLFGAGGCGKSYTVTRQLKELDVPYKAYNSRMTGRGLFNALERFADAIHLLEDMEGLFRDGGARGVLRSALWGDGPTRAAGPIERQVTWTTFRMEHSFVFTGGLIMIGNRPFGDLPELEAVKTRIAYMQLTISDNEIMALMRHIASEGYGNAEERMDAPECLDVCEHVIGQCRGLNRMLDMRMLVNSFEDYLQWRDCRSGCHWRDLVSARVKERPTMISETHNATARSAQQQHELAVARRLLGMENRQERFSIWQEEVGKSEQSMYRRLNQVNARGARTE